VGERIAHADAKRQQEVFSGKVARARIDIFGVSETIIFSTYGTRQEQVSADTDFS